MLLEIGKLVNFFDKDGWDSQEGIVIGYKDRSVTIKCKGGINNGKIYQIPNPKIEIEIWARGNGLDRYIISEI